MFILAKALGTSEGFWLGLQADYDLENCCNAIKKDLSRIVKLIGSSAPVTA